MNRLTLRKFGMVFILQLASCTFYHEPRPGLPDRGSIEAGETITVKGNENIYTIARAHNVSMREMIVLNDLQPPFSLKPGQSIVLPADTSGGNAMHGFAPPPQPAPSGVIEQQPLEPLPVSPRSDAAPVGPGAGTAAAGSVVAAPVTAAPTAAAPTTAAPTRATAVDDLNRPSVPAAHMLTTTVTPAPQATGKPVDIAAAATAAVAAPEPKPPTPPSIAPQPVAAFTAVWPVQGPILSNYGPKGQGLNNDGINIGAPKGSPVVAAAGGTVVYAGNEMKGFGNLLLIRHQGGWVTAYSHLDRMLVSKDAVVAQGDMIGTVGKTGNVPSPQLHFEVRQNGKPIDPNTVIGGG